MSTAVVGASPEAVARPNTGRMLWITVTWGGCFLAIRWGLRDAPVLWFAALRSLIAGAALFAYAATRRRRLGLPRRIWPTVAALSVANATLAFAAMFAGVAGLATGTAAVLANAQPLLIVLPARWLYHEAVTKTTVAALALGFTGLIVVALPGGGGQGAAQSLGAALALTAGTLLARRLTGIDIVVVSAWHFVSGGALLSAWAAAAEGAPAIDWTARFAVALAFLALVGTAAAFVAWFTETQRASLTQLAAWTFLVPVVSIALAAVFLDERPAGWTAVGVVLVLVSLWFVLRPQTSPSKRGPDEVRLDPGAARRLDLARLDAVIFDLDGVLTDTARVHAAAWARLFDEAVPDLARGEAARPFAADDYRRFVDGRSRIDGVEGFLASRGVRLARGLPTDQPEAPTAWGLANRKDLLFHEALARDGVEVFPTSVAFVDAVRAAGLRTAVVTASRNRAEVLAAVGLDGRFDAHVDGVDAAALGLPGKPDPATFVEAARRLGVAPGRAAVVEDALAGVEAARRGDFGVVVGVDRTGQAASLTAAGADIVVGDLDELELVPAGDR